MSKLGFRDLLSWKIYSRESLIKALNQTKLGQKAARQKNTSPLIRKSYSLFLRVMLKKGVPDVSDYDDE